MLFSVVSGVVGSLVVVFEVSVLVVFSLAGLVGVVVVFFVPLLTILFLDLYVSLESKVCDTIFPFNFNIL